MIFPRLERNTKTALCFLLAAFCVSDGGAEPVPPSRNDGATSNKQSPVTPTELKASIVIDAGWQTGRVNPLVFGHNLEAADVRGIFGPKSKAALPMTGDGFWDPVRAEPAPGVVDHARQAGVKLMRYPGGCLAHNFDWRKAAGPAAQRPDWQFGIDEFIELCREIGAEPVVTVSDYVLPRADMPQHAAELVEYLNSPALPGHPWAMKRKEAGHSQPYNVRWFELGNESDHGNHDVLPARKYSALDYAQYAMTTGAAMKRVDPSIKVGIVTVPSDGTDVRCEWNRTVIKQAGPSADFVIVHAYAPGAPKKLRKEETAEFFEACMASAEQVAHHLEEYHDLIVKETGRDLPLAITEFNVLAPKEIEGSTEMFPYRFTYGEALASADMLRLFVDPRYNVATASYWHLLNGYFGMLRSSPERNDKWEEKPMYPFYQLWTQHLGETLVHVDLDSPRRAFAGFAKTSAALGDKLIESVDLGAVPYTFSSGTQRDLTRVIETKASDAGYSMSFKNVSGQQYPLMAKAGRAPAKPDSACDYEVSFEARLISTDANRSEPIAVTIMDSRGWDRTGSATVISGISGPLWRRYATRFCTLGDCPGIEIRGRLEPGERMIDGLLELRDLRIEAFTRTQYPAYALLTITASLSADRGKLYLVAINKSESRDIAAALTLKGFEPASQETWGIQGTDWSTTHAPKIEHRPPVRPTGVLMLPARSMTVFEFKRGV